MAVYLIAGRLGSGKTLSAVGRIRDALRAGKRVATNLDLHLDALGFGTRSVDCVRLPDKPTGDELRALGHGNPGSFDESRNGLVVLDELSSWLNARTWGDKARQGVLDWFIHSRKLGWDVYLIAQSLQQLDKQLRDSLVEYHVICRRMDRLRIPLVGGLVKALSFGKVSGRMPRVHIAFVRYGTDRDSMLVERWTYRGNELFAGYDTRQRFVDREVSGRDADVVEACYLAPAAPFTYWLPSWARPKPAEPAAIVRELLKVADADKRVRLAAAYWRARDVASSCQPAAGAVRVRPGVPMLSLAAVGGRPVVPADDMGARGVARSVRLVDAPADGSRAGRASGRP